MSRFVAVFTIFLYVCVVSGQEHNPIRLKGTPTDPSISIDVISGGNYPDGSFSIGYGRGDDHNGHDDTGPGVNQGRGGHSGNGPIYPTTGQGRNEEGFINGQNDINSYSGPNNQNDVNNYGVIQNPRQKPVSPYDYDYNKQNNNTPVKNSASRNNFLTQLYNYVFRWYF